VAVETQCNEIGEGGWTVIPLTKNVVYGEVQTVSMATIRALVSGLSQYQAAKAIGDLVFVH
jgi:hypothetical protein